MVSRAGGHARSVTIVSGRGRSLASGVAGRDERYITPVACATDVVVLAWVLSVAASGVRWSICRRIR